MKNDFIKTETKRLKLKYGIKLSTQLTENCKGHQLFDYMMEFAERYRKFYPEVRHKRELKCQWCDFETEKQNIKGLDKHMQVRHNK
jgi:hypothetical protein